MAFHLVLAVTPHLPVFYLVALKSAGEFPCGQKPLSRCWWLWIHDAWESLRRSGSTSTQGQSLRKVSGKQAFFFKRWSFVIFLTTKSTDIVPWYHTNSPSVWAPVQNMSTLLQVTLFGSQMALIYTRTPNLLITYSLLKLYRYNNSSDITINDAEWVLSKWVPGNKFWHLPLRKSEFAHVPASDKHYIRNRLLFECETWITDWYIKWRCDCRFG